MANRKKSSQSSRKGRHWHLLLINGHGEMIAIGRIKGLMIALGVAAVTMFVAAAVFFCLNRQLAVTQESLQNTLAEMTSRLVSFRNDRDLCMARLVALESRCAVLQEDSGETSMPVSLSQKDEDGGPAKAAGGGQPVTGETVAGSHAGGVEKDLPVATGSSGLAIENFTLTYDAAIQTLKAGYRIKVTDPLIEHITGRTIVILKPGRTKQSRWMPLPTIDIDPEGRPADWQKGQLFSISNFRDIGFEAKSRSRATEFTLATVFVYSETGEVLLKKDFSLTEE